MSNYFRFFCFSCLSLLLFNTASATLLPAEVCFASCYNTSIAQVTVTQNAAAEYVLTFSLRPGKSWSPGQFVTQCDRWMPDMVASGSLLTCSFDENTQTVTALFDAPVPPPAAASPYFDAFFKKFGYHGGYVIL